MHNVINRLHVIMGCIDMCEVEKDDDEKRHHWSTKAKDEIRNLNALLQEHAEPSKKRNK